MPKSIKNSKKNKQDFDRSSKKNSIYKWAASFYLMNISMPNNDRTGGTFLNYPQKRCYTDITCSQKPKNNSFLFLKKTTYLFYNSTTMNQIYFQNCMWLCMTLYLLTYLLLKSTYLLLVSFLFFCVFSLFVFFFFCKKPNPDYFFCKKILRTFLPPPNECYVVFLISKHLKKKKKGSTYIQKTQNKHQISSQSIISRWTKKKMGKCTHECNLQWVDEEIIVFLSKKNNTKKLIQSSTKARNDFKARNHHLEPRIIGRL